MYLHSAIQLSSIAATQLPFNAHFLESVQQHWLPCLASIQESVCVCLCVYEGQGRFMYSSPILITECKKDKRCYWCLSAFKAKPWHWSNWDRNPLPKQSHFRSFPPGYETHTHTPSALYEHFCRGIVFLLSVLCQLMNSNEWIVALITCRCYRASETWGLNEWVD